MSLVLVFSKEWYPSRPPVTRSATLTVTCAVITGLQRALLLQSDEERRAKTHVGVKVHHSQATALIQEGESAEGLWTPMLGFSAKPHSKPVWKSPSQKCTQPSHPVPFTQPTSISTTLLSFHIIILSMNIL